MLKKIVIFLLCVFPVTMMAQELKLGHVNSQEILMAMPEMATIEKTLDDLQTEWENTIVKSREEYMSKIKDFQEKQATMPESIKQARQSEIIDIEQRLSTLNQTASQDLQQKQQELLVPVIEKIRKAISEVGAENKFTYIFDLATQSILFEAQGANDATPLVKAKLGIK